MSDKRILLTAPKSGSGKTTITCGILAALKRRGIRITSLKCGPDYIDPMFHRAVLGVRTGNLDTFFTNAAMTRHLLLTHMKEAELTVIEGAMGYFDGLGGVSSRGSSYEIGSVTETPAILIVDGKGASVSLAAVIDGMARYQVEGDNLLSECRKREHNGIAGIILNRVSAMYYPRLKAVVEKGTGIPVLGFMPVMKDFEVPSRHLGLVAPEEMESIDSWITALAEQVEKYIDLDKLIEIASTASEISEDVKAVQNLRMCIDNETKINSEREAGEEILLESNVRIAVAEDEAFTFTYTENMTVLKELGAEIVPFSPIRDKELPADIDGLILGGGYPERFAKELSENHSLCTSIAKNVDNGLPTVAECGGFLYLGTSLEGEDGNVYPMCGVLPGKGYRTSGLRRFGYLKAVTETDGLFGPKGTVLMGHEFHHWDTDANGDGLTLTKPLSGKTERGIIYTDTLAAGFPHFYYPGSVDAAAAFVAKCGDYRSQKDGENNE